MFNLTANNLKIRLVIPSTDLRKSFTGLSGVIQDLHCGELNPQYLYLFSNKNRNRLKILYYDRRGVYVSAKRLEQGNFSWPPRRDSKEQVMSFTSEAFQLLLDGVDLRGAELREWYRAPNP